MKNFNYDHFPPGKWRKILSIMRLKLLILLCSVGTLTASPSFSQRAKLNVSYNKVSLVSVLNDLKAKTGYHFFYFDGVVPQDINVTADLQQASITEILDQVLVKNGFTYKVENDVISIGRAQTPMNQAQQPVVAKGRVSDSGGKPIAGVSVILKGATGVGTVTDASGNFNLRLSAPAGAVLQFSFLGKEPVEVKFAGQTEIPVVMKDAVAKVDDVVITGIFNKPKESYTGAVTTISAKELSVFRGQNLIQTLANIDPSINVLADNLSGSDPNRIPDITIRGSSSLPLSVEELNQGQKYNLNTPLIIMDGFEVSLQKLMDYNDEEIQSINILKDASATAIYGSRGANGVIVIISKQPASGPLRVNFKMNIDVEIPDLSSYDLLNASEKLKLEWDNGFYIDKDPAIDLRLKQVYYQRYRDMTEGTDTYWLGKPLHTAVSQKYNVRFEGGSQEFRWGVTTAYNRVNGVMKNSSRDTFTGQIMLQYQYKNIIFRNQTEVANNKGTNSNYGSFSDYSKMNPYFKLYDDEGALIKNFIGMGGSASVANPLHNATLNSINESAYTQIIDNFSVDWNIAQGLTLRGKFGISRETSTKDVFVPPGNTKFATYSVLEKGSYTYSPGEANSYDGSLTLGYTRTFNEKHQLYAGFDWSILQRESNVYTLQGVGFTSEKLSSLGNALSYPTSSKPTEVEDKTRSVGFTGTVNYTYDNRYFVDGSYRTDGSSQFGTNKRFAPFWSIGIGWNIHNEEFLKGHKLINSLRLKASYGQTGSQQFSAYQAMRSFKYYTADRYGAWSGAYLQSLGNEDLRWQITDQFNIGTEIGILNNRITASLDYYMKKTSNLLSNIDIPLATGFDSYIANIGEVKNNGFEASLGAYLIRNAERDITWMVTGKIAYNKNEITKLSDDVKRQTAEYLLQDVDMSTLFYEGYAQNSLYVVRSLGIDPSTGNEIFLDRNGNVVNEWKASDKVYAGIQDPSFRGNFSTMFRYKNLSLNLSFAYHWGGVQYNSTLLNRVEILRDDIIGQNVDRRVLTDRWSQPGDVATFKKIPSADQVDSKTRGTTRFVMEDRLLQLQTASIEYRLETEWLKKAGIQNARIGANMSDLLYISSVKRERGLDYPFARRIGASLSLLF